MAFITKDIDELLKPANLEINIFEKMNPELSMLGMFEKKNNQSRKEFAFAKNTTNAEKLILDGIMKEPVEIREAADFPEVQIIGINKNIGKMRKLGFQAKFTQEAISDDINYDKIQLTTEMMGYSIARYLNRHAYQILIQSAGSSTADVQLGDGAWDEGNESIDDDFKHIKRAFESQEGFEYTLTDAFVSQEAEWAAEDYYDAVRDGGYDPNNVRKSRLRGIQELESGLLGLDMNVKPAKWYYNIDGRHNLFHDKYGTFIHINRYDQVDLEPAYTIIQMYVIYGFGVINNDAVCFVEGV